MTKSLTRFFCFAVLAHLLLLLSFSLQWLFHPELRFEKKSDRYLPAYLHTETNSEPRKSSNLPPKASTETTPSEPQNHNRAAILLKKQEMQQPVQTSPSFPSRSHRAATFIQAESLKSGKPLDEPLLKELSRATAAKLSYPSKAAAFHITGTVTIRFLLFPDGRVTEVTLAQSSGFRILDEAALNTIKAISPVRDANLYLVKPRYLLAGIIFG